MSEVMLELHQLLKKNNNYDALYTTRICNNILANFR
jgi:hypothetical protein